MPYTQTEQAMGAVVVQVETDAAGHLAAVPAEPTLLQVNRNILVFHVAGGGSPPVVTVNNPRNDVVYRWTLQHGSALLEEVPVG